MPTRQSNRQRSFIQNPLKIGALLIVLAIIAVSVAALIHAKKVKSNNAASGTIKTINSQPGSNNPKSSQSSTPNAGVATNSEKTSTSSQPAADSKLTAPYGSFVSNHKPGQNGSDLTELSQCTTTPGATCYIKFTQNGVAKTLPQQVVGSDGTTFWEWKISDAGLTSGQWSIAAVATLNGQTQTTTDRLMLEVQ